MGENSAAIWLAGGLLVVGLVGCGGKKEEAAPADGAQVQETGKEVSKNPIEAMAQVGQAMQKAGEQMQAAANRPPVEPVKFDVLLAFLPPGEGWKAAEPKGSTTAMGEWKITVVSRELEKDPPAEGQDAPRVQAEITDGGFVPAVYAPFHMMAQFSQESTEGYQKGVTVDGYPGMEKWEKADRQAELWVLVADRFLVHLQGSAVEPQALRDLLGTMRLAELAKLAA